MGIRDAEPIGEKHPEPIGEKHPEAVARLHFGQKVDIFLTLNAWRAS